MIETRRLPGICAILFAGWALATPVAGQLTVVGTSPAAGSRTTATTGAITVTFDRAVDAASVGTGSFWAFGRWSGTVAGSYALGAGGTTVTLTPARAFSAGESVIVILSNGLMAMDGSSLRSAGFSFQFWVKAAPSSLEYESHGTLVTGTPSRPYGGFASDLDEDGYLDITTVNEDTDDLRVFLNTADGSGTFASHLLPTAGTGNVPSPSEPADFDRDGHVDVVLANTQGNSISVLLGNGDGTFGTQQEIALGDASRGVAVLDVDGDGDLDVAATQRFTGRIAFARNNGSGVFGSPTFLNVSGVEPWALAAGDMNGDGITDLVVGSRVSQRIDILLGQGAGTFVAGGGADAGGAAWMVVLGDVDGDGDEDVSVANPEGNGAILHGDGAGGLGAAEVYATDSFSLATDLADLDGDGDLDWIVASFGGDWSLWRNDGGTFVFDREFDAPSAASCSLAMDFDNDGDLDLALIDELANVIDLYRNPGLVFADGFESGDADTWSVSVP